MSAAVFAHRERRTTAMPAEARQRQELAAVSAPLRCGSGASILAEDAHDSTARDELLQDKIERLRRHIEARIEQPRGDAAARDRREHLS